MDYLDICRFAILPTTIMNFSRYIVNLLRFQYFRDLDLFTTVQALDGSEFDMQDIPLDQANRTAAVFISQSGETKDLYRCLKICRNSGVLVTIGIINSVDSQIAREVDCGCYLC